jgi:hypothetical protein
VREVTRATDEVSQAAKSADKAMLSYAESYGDVTHSAGLSVSQLARVRSEIGQTGDGMKLAADRSDKFAAGMDTLTAAAQRNKQALDEAAQRAEAYAAAFGAVEGDYTTELQGADEPLVTPERTVNVTTQISGPTEAQRQAVTAYTDALERLREKYFDLTNGVGTFGMEQGKLDEAIAETAGEIAHYEGLLAGIPPAVNDVSTSQQGLIGQRKRGAIRASTTSW